ncbi:murein biosynthesis integral membrane protein MurJ [Planococcus sp. YIM B11945]|uniref:murein biosynthesis integral membrane protein MurJ n=1 Tax=Planococcus sp. YIM B11945 TaxID=3435410 RepID=UPI003D7D94B0
MGRKLAITSILFVIASLFLKISGLARDMIIAFYFGDSYQAMAYFAAFTLPNMFILFFATGMKNAFVPSYIHAAAENKGHHHFSQIIRGTMILGFVVSALGVLLSPVLLPFMYPELSAQAIDLSVSLSVIFFIAVFLVSLNSVYEAYLDAENKFSLSVVSQILVIGSTILSGILFSDQIGAFSLAYGYLAGSLLSYVIKRFWFIPKGSHKIIGKIDWDELKPFSIVFIPVAITVMVGQVNLTIDNIFAGQFNEAAINYINYAKNIVHFPQAIIGVTIGTIIFPMLAKTIATNNQEGFKKGIENGLMLTLMILLPAIAGMMWLMEDLIHIVYERGAFTADATLATAKVGYLYLGSVLFFSLQNILNKAFYSKKKGHVILRISLFSVALNVALNFLFIELFDSYLGIPLASSVMALVYFFLNLVVFWKTEGRLNVGFLLKDSTKIVAATIVMLLALWASHFVIGAWNVYIRFAVTILIGAASYGLAILMMRTSISKLLLAKLKK